MPNTRPSNFCRLCNDIIHKTEKGRANYYHSDEIGANKEDFLEALNEVPAMSADQFNKVAKMLFAYASELSEKAYNNLLLKIQITELKQV